MGKSVIICVVAGLFLFPVHGAVKKGDKASRGQKAAADSSWTHAFPSGEAGYPDSLAASFHYIEGLKFSKLLYNNNDHAHAALEQFDTAIELDPLHAPSYYESAYVLMAQNDPVKALEFCRRACELEPDNVWYKSLLGRLLVANMEYRQAQEVYEELIALAPHSPENYSMLASLYQRIGQPFTAIAVLDKAESVVGSMEVLTEQKRDLLVGMKLYDRAIEEGKRLVKNYPYDYGNYVSLAELYTEKGQDSLALVNYRMAQALNPDGYDVLLSMNEYYRIMGDTPNFFATARKIFQGDEMRPEMKKRYFGDIVANREFYRDNYFPIKELAAVLLAKYPNDYDVVDLYAGTMMAWGDSEGALSFYKGYISDTLTSPRIFNDILGIEAYLKRPDSLYKYADMGLRMFPDNANLYIRKAGALEYYLQRRKEAEKAYRQALKYADNDSLRSAIYGALGDLYQKGGDSGKSYKSYDKSLELWPDNTMILNNYAYYLSEQDLRLEQALGMSARVIETLAPGNPTYIDTYGWILYKLKRFEEAKKYLQQAIALDTGGSSELFMHYGDVLYALGDSYMASVYWKRALDAGYYEKQVEQRLKLTGEK